MVKNLAKNIFEDIEHPQKKIGHDLFLELVQTCPQFITTWLNERPEFIEFCKSQREKSPLFFFIYFFLVFSDICSQKRDSGICPGNVPRFYFEKSLGMCQLFSYGGCGGNSNNFEILDQCVANCGGPKEDVFQISTLTGI